jgi:hypothetical protein
MKAYSLSHLADHVLLRDLAGLVARDRTTTAALLAHLAEVDSRRLYLPAAYPSMFAYCVGELRLSEDATFRRIRAARTARQFPAIFTAVSDGRLNLNAILMLTPYLTPDTAAELLAAAAHKTKPEIELLLAQRFPQPDLPAQVRALTPTPPTVQPAPQPLGAPTDAPVARPGDAQPCQLAPAPVGMTTPQHAPAHVDLPLGRSRVAPLSPERFALQVTVGQATHDKLRRAQELLEHALPSGDVAQVLDRALDALIHQLERRKLAATDRPRSRRSRANGRYIPAEVKRQVSQRDGDRCTFVSERGQRCSERRFLEFDHVDPVARGGSPTAKNLRLRCRAHNQYAAERAFGKGFMDEKRQEARRRVARACEPAPAGMAKLARNGTVLPPAPA